MDTYIVTAKTVEEAYAIANAKYADDKHEVSCEVIEMPKKGFLGIGSRDAKIKVTVTPAVSADLGSIVADMRGMKKYTDRGGDGQKEKAQNNQQKQKPNRPEKQDNRNNSQNNQNNQKKNENKGENKGSNDNSRNNGAGKGQQKQKPNKAEKQDNRGGGQPRPEPKAENKPSQKQKKQKSALHNGAKPNVRPQIKHIDGEGVTGASVTVGSPVGLTDFVSDNKQSSFGNGARSGGSMSNDIRKKKSAKILMPADKADEKMRASKYDVAESDDDYKSIESMVRENEAILEKEAGAALGFREAEAESATETPAPEARKKEPITQAEMDYALDFANTLLGNMNVAAKAVPCECPEGEEFEVTDEANVYPKIEIIGDETGILIGHHGETLDAIQYLVNLSALRKTKSKDGDYVKIVVDTENYREKRAETLKALARRMAAKAVKYKRNVFLEPMNAYERRIIHSELQRYPDVSTHSVGTDRDRKIIITYEGADKQTDNHSRRRRGQRSNRGPKPETNAPATAEQKAERTEAPERRRPRKIQKVPIEQLTDILDGNGFLDGGKTEE